MEINDMKKILVICHDIPSMTVGATLPIYHLIKNLSNNYELSLICFDSNKYRIQELEPYLKNIHSIKIPQYLSIKDQLLYTLKNMITLDNIHTRSFLNYYYHKDMSNLIKTNVEDYDIIITDMPMAFYTRNIEHNKIIYAFDAVGDYNYKMYEKAATLPSKIYWYLNYFKINRYEKAYDKFDSCIVVNDKDKKLLQRKLNVEITVVANGVDTNYFKNQNKDETKKLVFLGDMSTPPNNDAVKYFVEEIYPLILKRHDIKLYIVGRNPSNYIKSLSNDNIIVTGEVEDVRDYLGLNSIFVTPMISGTGIKNKILEAMSMELAVVSTSTGISGIDAVKNKEYLLADNAMTFAENVCELIEDDNLQSTIGENSRKMVIDKYSWIKASKKIDEIIKTIIND